MHILEAMFTNIGDIHKHIINNNNNIYIYIIYILVGAQPLTCCSFARHLVGKMVICCSFAHH